MIMGAKDDEIIQAYNSGKSMNAVAREFGMYASGVQRILKRHGIESRHDAKTEGTLFVKDGEKLIEWAKAQGRLVTKTELAAVIGTKKLSPSYFIKYPELGQYVVSRERKDTQGYTQLLYDWLKENNIPYKPKDRTKLQVTVDALLLGEYSNLAIQVDERPIYVSKKTHEAAMGKKIARAEEIGIKIIFLNKTHFENLDSVKEILNKLKY